MHHASLHSANSPKLPALKTPTKVTGILSVETQRIIRFIESIGIPVTIGAINTPTFLPGIFITNGGMTVDPDKLLYPGDLLHEAGHIAVAEPDDRLALQGDIGANTVKHKADGEEMMAIAWSYAACVHLHLDLEVLFHPAGYKGSAEWHIEQYKAGNMLYLPLMQWAGFCYDARQAAENNARPFPHMIKWLRS